MRKKGEKTLTERQKRFADYYIELGNACQAASKAGFNRNYGAMLKQNSVVKAYIEQRLSQLDDQRIATAREVLTYLTGVMRGDEPDAEDGKKGDRTSRMKAAELLGKRLGIFNEQTGTIDSAPVIVDDIGDKAQ